jgi:hypothetical protein
MSTSEFADFKLFSGHKLRALLMPLVVLLPFGIGAIRYMQKITRLNHKYLLLFLYSSKSS